MQILAIAPSNLLTLNSVKIGSAIQLVLLSFALADKNNLSRTRTLKSEAGYRHLMLNSRNIVFTLDDDFRFRTVNPVVQEYLGVPAQEVLGTSFVELIFPEEMQTSSEVRGDFEENLRELMQSDNKERLRFIIRSRNGSEGRPMLLRLDYAQGEDERQLLGELAPITEDTLKKSIREEEQTYLIGNSVITDEGPGFDHKAMLKAVEQRVREEMNANGRGLLMIQTEFDRVEFNDKGNSITLIRFFKKGGERS